MLSFDEFKYALSKGHQGPHWLNAYIDRVGRYWIQGNAGMGSSYYSHLEDDHPFIEFIRELFESGVLMQEDYGYHDEIGIELAQLVPLASSKL